MAYENDNLRIIWPMPLRAGSLYAWRGFASDTDSTSAHADYALSQVCGGAADAVSRPLLRVPCLSETSAASWLQSKSTEPKHNILVSSPALEAGSENNGLPGPPVRFRSSDGRVLTKVPQ